MPYYASEYAGDPAEPVAVTEATNAGLAHDHWYIGKAATGRHGVPHRTVNEYALVWAEAAVSAPGVYLIANQPDDALNNPRVNAINAALGTVLERPVTFAQAARQILTEYPWLYRQVPIGYDGTCTVTVGPYAETWDQSENTAPCLWPDVTPDAPPFPGIR